MAGSDLKDRFLGCLIGQAVGDALGAPYEGFPADFRFWDKGPVDELLDESPDEVLRYTDDTQMMIGVAEALLADGEILHDSLAQRFATNYDPERGYGAGAAKIMETMLAGGDWKSLTKTIFPGGSFGNGAAMRAAPVGLFFNGDLGRVAQQSHESALPTHLHPLGLEGARLFALAIALALRGPPFDRADFYSQLENHCQSEEFLWQLQAGRELKRHHSLAFLGNSLPAHRSVVTAIACFTTACGAYEEAVTRAISLGDDSDTLAAMAGALCGAHMGLGGVPDRWVRRLEQGPKGADYIRRLAEGLYERHREFGSVAERE